MEYFNFYLVPKMPHDPPCLTWSPPVQAPLYSWGMFQEEYIQQYASSTARSIPPLAWTAPQIRGQVLIVNCSKGIISTVFKMKQSKIIGCDSSPPQHRMLWVPRRTDWKQVVVMSDSWGWVHMSRLQYPPILIVTSIICQTGHRSQLSLVVLCGEK